MGLHRLETLKLVSKSEREQRAIVRKALENAHGIVNLAADRLGVSQSFLKRFVQKDRTLLDGLPRPKMGPRT